MKSLRRFLLPAACTAALLCAGVASFAAEEDVFAFIPPGGRTLFARVLGTHPAAAEVNAMLAAKHTREEWLAYLRGHTAQYPAAAKMSEKELTTLADYLSFNLPLAAGKVTPSAPQAAIEKALPIDGRDMALEKCQGCHIITVVITQNRTREAWLGTMNKPSHVMIKLGKEQREALANYLVLNAAIPIDDVPQELRAGGASY
jgi:mono/diheme cytochrome c family protein